MFQLYNVMYDDTFHLICLIMMCTLSDSDSCQTDSCQTDSCLTVSSALAACIDICRCSVM